MKQYIIKYKVFTLPYWYEFKCYSDSSDDAITQFLKENMIGMESFRIAAILDI